MRNMDIITNSELLDANVLDNIHNPRECLVNLKIFVTLWYSKDICYPWYFSYSLFYKKREF